MTGNISEFENHGNNQVETPPTRALQRGENLKEASLADINTKEITAVCASVTAAPGCCAQNIYRPRQGEIAAAVLPRSRKMS